MTTPTGWSTASEIGRPPCRSVSVTFQNDIQPNGWEWSFRIRTGSQSDVDSNGETEEGHSTRRTRKLARLEAVLLVADGALSLRKLAQFATLADAAEARRLVQELNDRLSRSGAAFRIEKVATGFRMMTRPQFATWLDRLHNRQAKAKLSPPMLETLAIVAYRQPATRADVEKIRGVQASEMLKQLMERGLVRITGEDNSLGRPFLYGTTRQFLEEYGFGSLDDLPMAETLRRQDKPADVEAEVDEAEEADGAESTDDVIAENTGSPDSVDEAA
ncbi:MAG: SMC-Scp complex subunit ScpB [Planctomycetota bacterium]|nr:SMC-Scp complex subunit ScpB [Planctomycetota bacterium]MDA1163955.1 SMC-Scp complex subunit ScpB [Planctomycetota bacterium]